MCHISDYFSPCTLAPWSLIPPSCISMLQAEPNRPYQKQVPLLFRNVFLVLLIAVFRNSTPWCCRPSSVMKDFCFILIFWYGILAILYGKTCASKISPSPFRYLSRIGAALPAHLGLGRNAVVNANLVVSPNSPMVVASSVPDAPWSTRTRAKTSVPPFTDRATLLALTFYFW